jgi:hypothetical protein
LIVGAQVGVEYRRGTLNPQVEAEASPEETN